MVSIYEGRRDPFEKRLLVRIQNEGEFVATEFRRGPHVPLSMPFHDGPADHYTIVVSTKGYRDTGYSFRVDPARVVQLSLLMIPNDHQFTFLEWAHLADRYAAMAAFLDIGGIGQRYYSELAKNNPKALACLLNLATALAGIDLGGDSAISFFKAICWDNTMQQDRFFGYVAPEMIARVRAAERRGLFAEEKNCAAFHPGATCSWKQIAYDVANVQLTFHERSTRVIDGITCVRIETDIDNYRNVMRHGVREVIPNLLTGRKTEPAGIYALRWAMAEARRGPEFDPGYLLT